MLYFTWMSLKYLVLSAALSTLVWGQTVVQVPATAQIFLAGRPSGAFISNNAGTDTAPANSPTLADLRLRGGQALSITATGTVRLFGGSTQANIGPNGSEQEVWQPNQDNICFAGGCLGGIWARRGALVGIFLGAPDIGSTVRANFLSAAEAASVQQPLVSQPFLIGDGKTSEGILRTFVVPPGATRLYLGVLGVPVSGNSGGFTATISEVPAPPIAGSANPVRVPGNANPILAGLIAGELITPTSHVYDFAPLNAPVVVDLKPLGGRIIQISAIGRVSAVPGGERIGPDGLIGTYANWCCDQPRGFNGITAPLGALVGVFIRDQLNPELSSAGTDYSTASQRDLHARAPAIQQFFYIGSGRTGTGEMKRYAIPEGATRLCLGVMDAARFGWNQDNTGWFFVSVTPDSGQEPAITTGLGGVVNGASYSSPPLTAGSFAAIFGDRLSASTDTAAAVPLPTRLAGSTVWINGIAAPLYFASPKQINLQIPTALEGETQVQVLVSNGSVPGVPAVIPLAPFSPGIFLYGGAKPVIVNASTGNLATEDEPVKRGETLVIYSTGLGSVSPAGTTGEPASVSVLSRVTRPVSVLIGNVTHTPAFAGLAPGLIGVYQVNVQLLPSVAAGAQKLQIVSGNIRSNAVEVTISQ